MQPTLHSRGVLRQNRKPQQQETRRACARRGTVATLQISNANQMNHAAKAE